MSKSKTSSVSQVLKIVYKYTIGCVVKLFKNIWKKVKFLGWFWGSICTLIAGVVFYSPAIVLFILGFKVLAVTYILWWLSPAFSPALVVYFAILSSVIWVVCKIRGKKIIVD